MRHHHHSSSSSSSMTKNPLFNICKHHSSSETLDILIIILALFSATFLVTSYLSYVIHTLSLLNIPLLIPLLIISLSFLFITNNNNNNFLFLLFVSLLFGGCRKKGCKRVDNPNDEFDISIQTEGCLKECGDFVREVDRLPWKGGHGGENPDYDVFREELRAMAPVNGRAVLVFRAKCGCAESKLVGWGPIVKRTARKHRKALILNGGDHR